MDWFVLNMRIGNPESSVPALVDLSSGYLNPAFDRYAAEKLVNWCNGLYEEFGGGSAYGRWEGDILCMSDMESGQKAGEEIEIEPDENGLYRIAWYRTWEWEPADDYSSEVIWRYRQGSPPERATKEDDEEEPAMDWFALKMTVGDPKNSFPALVDLSSGFLNPAFDRYGAEKLIDWCNRLYEECGEGCSTGQWDGSTLYMNYDDGSDQEIEPDANGLYRIAWCHLWEWEPADEYSTEVIRRYRQARASGQPA
ncbi:hypothetical protein M8C13_08970 [Crossiella sp. SN42]|uniref:hypothetical protein n=1 Tax=Crossiella sp. SN42 TaxID=2944808 RepID=UPI00207CE4A1|nr:hypothetical protein [Crossiella sp. SN42]MCO1575888.1 hypothetical protein [Crossiella sp. SN42]